MTRLTARDAAYVLLDRDQRDAHVISCTILSTPDGVNDELRADLLARIARWVHNTEELHQIPVRVPVDLDLPVWHRVDALDLDSHVEIHDNVETWSDAQELISAIANKPLELTRPAWRLDVVTDVAGLPGIGGRVTILAVSYHHAVMDGRRFQQVMFQHDWNAPLTATHSSATAFVAESTPHRSRLLIGALAAQPRIWARFAWAATRLLAQRLASAWRPGRCGPVTALTGVDPRRSHLCGPTTGRRTVGLTSVTVDEVAVMRARVPLATVNDLLVSVIGQAVRSYLVSSGDRPSGGEPTGDRLAGEVFAAVPVFVGEAATVNGSTSQSHLRNRFTTVAVNTRSEITDVARRVATIHEEIAVHKNRVRTAAAARGVAGLIHAMPAPVLSVIGMILRRRGAPPSPVDIVISNLADVPGVDRIAGLTVVGAFGVTSLSSPRLAHVIYRRDNRLFISVTADSAAVDVLDDYLALLNRAIDDHRSALTTLEPTPDVP